MQESFARLYEKYTAEQFTPQLLYTIGRNLVLDALRKRKHNPSEMDRRRAAGSTARNTISWCATSTGRCLPPCGIWRTTKGICCRSVVSSELSYRELAEITGLSEANVKVKIHRARKKLRALPRSGKK
ncbi:MAG: hypothetical protein MZV70_49930 [Desulfobacterales bacterium]|nr:hypothetical protein [Desulfobacterales bacterium]